MVIPPSPGAESLQDLLDLTRGPGRWWVVKKLDLGSIARARAMLHVALSPDSWQDNNPLIGYPTLVNCCRAIFWASSFLIFFKCAMPA